MAVPVLVPGSDRTLQIEEETFGRANGWERISGAALREGNLLMRSNDDGSFYLPFTLPNLRIAEGPAKGTEIIFVRSPAQLSPLYPHAEWHDGLMLVMFRNKEAGVRGAIFVHSPKKVDYLGGRYASLGGLMNFANVPYEKALMDVLGKGLRMADKFIDIDKNLQTMNHPVLTQLGGGKAVVVHDEGDEDSPQVKWQKTERAMRITGEVTRVVGLHILGDDQGTSIRPGDDAYAWNENVYQSGHAWSSIVAEHAPEHFGGAAAYPIGHGSWQGMGNPSPHTANGVIEGIKEVTDLILGGQKGPVFLQGAGGVGGFVYQFLLKNEYQISAVSEVKYSDLVKVAQLAESAGRPIPKLIFDYTGAIKLMGPDKAKAELDKVERDGRMLVVNGLAEALHRAPETKLFSPNASAFAIDWEVAKALVDIGAKAIAGAANNTIKPDANGSTELIEWYLQLNNVFHPDPSRLNSGGAASVTVGKIGIDPAVFERDYPLAVGLGTRDEILQAFVFGVPPAQWTYAQAAAYHQQQVAKGLVLGNVPLFAPPAVATPADHIIAGLGTFFGMRPEDVRSKIFRQGPDDLDYEGVLSVTGALGNPEIILPGGRLHHQALPRPDAASLLAHADALVEGTAHNENPITSAPVVAARAMPATDLDATPEVVATPQAHPLSLDVGRYGLSTQSVSIATTDQFQDLLAQLTEAGHQGFADTLLKEHGSRFGVTADSLRSAADRTSDHADTTRGK